MSLLQTDMHAGALTFSTKEKCNKDVFEGFFFWGGGWLGDYIKTLPNSQYVIIIDGNKNRWVG